MATCRWILENPSKDALLILFPGFLAASYFMVVEANSGFYELMAFVVMGLIDSGHVYSTLWRTYFHSDERRSSAIYIWVPVIIFFIAFSWFYFQIPYIYSFIFYATAYHHIRQYFGVVKWYEKLEQSYTKLSGTFLYLLSICPAVAAHFRHNLTIEFYTKKDLLMYPNKELFNTVVFINLFLIFVYCFYEFWLWKRGRFKLNRTLAVVSPVILYSMVFYLGKNSFQILLPLMVAHGIPYFSMLGVSLKRTRSSKFPDFKSVIKAILLTSLLFGSFEFYFESEIIDFDDSYLFVRPDVIDCLLIAFYTIPLMAHYTLDAFIWKSNHREGRLVFGDSVSKS